MTILTIAKVCDDCYLFNWVAGMAQWAQAPCSHQGLGPITRLVAGLPSSAVYGDVQ